MEDEVPQWHVIIKRQFMRMSVIVSRSLQLQAESHARRLQVCQKIFLFRATYLAFFAASHDFSVCHQIHCFVFLELGIAWGILPCPA